MHLWERYPRLAGEFHYQGGTRASYVINHLVRDGAVVLEEIEVRGLGGRGQLLDHGLLKEEMSACRP
ncbi:hypothetical protein IMZ48_43195 [Candidatus Bathyarchaeota archaeon]|nr:hypothetical protein [Candidatus Bathyarchaeota archaeon]